jgi:signal transduction histidine kinase
MSEDASELIRQRRSFSRFTDAEAALLVEVRPTFERHAEGVVDAFYDHLLRFDPLVPMLANPETVRRLKLAQRQYLLSLTDGTFDEAYAQTQLRTGTIHDAIGLSLPWYLGTYGFYVDLLAPLIHEHHAANPGRAVQTVRALVKRFLLDAQFVSDAYYEARRKKAVARSEQLAAVGELAASVAHEVRNPLAGMKGALEVMGKQLSDPDHRDVIAGMLGQIGRMENLVHDLLSYARPRPIAPAPVNVRELLDRLLRLFQDNIQKAGITVERKSEPGSDVLHADPELMEQVFINLIQNAIQSMDSGGKLSLATRREAEGVAVAFTDTGKGIPASVLPHVFAPFFTTKHRGSGLGLAIVKKILEQHGGRIDIESREGRGTTATIAVPSRVGELDV